MDLLRNIARRFRTPDRDELEAELARKLVALKVKAPADIVDWRAYIAKFFFNKASNWIRDERARAARRADPPGGIDEDEHTDTAARAIDRSNPAPELAPALAAVWHELSPLLRNLWIVLLEENGNQVRVGQRLNRHRNTVRAWTRKIQDVLMAHGLEPPFHTRRRKNRPDGPIGSKSMRNSDRVQETFAVFSARLLQSLLMLPLSGTQWRILVWVIRHAARRKQRTIPCQWADVARALSLSRSSAWRAGRALLKMRVLYEENARIGLRREFTSSSRTR
jgi:hypothetical protein